MQALFHPTRLGLVEPLGKAGKDEWVFVYGGSSELASSSIPCAREVYLFNLLSGSVGMFAIQLAHAAGYKVVTVASPRNFELVRSLGADAVFDVSSFDV